VFAVDREAAKGSKRRKARPDTPSWGNSREACCMRPDSKTVCIALETRRTSQYVTGHAIKGRVKEMQPPTLQGIVAPPSLQSVLPRVPSIQSHRVLKSSL
jgi:hypothetical protein